MKKQYICLFFACLTFLLTGCDKYLDIQPTGSVIPHTLAEYRALWLNACTTVPADRGLAGMGADEMFVSNKNDQDKYGAKYSELTIQITALAKEMERVRKLIEIATSIDAINIEDKEVEIYTTQGFLVKRVKLSDNDPFRNIPDGVYIVDGKKVYIHAK